ncbi:MAG: uroporphyrinogen-III C-methyltransferase [Kangiellaceae bacterium]|nr:uroporphyrinogen-III C-methyltransferase [Kangiellaceae bacterium]
MEYLPITVQLEYKACLIVGGGDVALRKLKHLQKAGASVTLVAKQFSEEILEYCQNSTIAVHLIKSAYEAKFLAGQFLVVAATNNYQVNKQVSNDATEQRIWVNVVDDLENSTFIMPAVVDRSPLLVAISTSGVSPVLARKIKEKLEWILPDNLSILLNRLKDYRPKLKKKYHSFKDKRSFNEWYIDKSFSGELTQINDFESAIKYFETDYLAKGKVYLIGAGPGDPELLTVKALKILQKADVVLHDALISEGVMALIRKDASLVNVGKRAKGHSKKQEEINELLIEYGKQNLTVARLKGGDPFIYGRGGEELEVLVENQIDFEVVPGITAASGCASYAGIPLTHREYSQTVMFITAHCKNSEDSLNWPSIARQNQTVVVYMGLLRNHILSEQMIKYGRDPDTSVAIVENGTSPSQRVAVGRLCQLSELVEQYQITSPSLIIIGEVVQLAEKLAWYQSSLFLNENNQEPRYLLKEAV